MNTIAILSPRGPFFPSTPTPTQVSPMPHSAGHEEVALPSSPLTGGAVSYNQINKELQPLPSMDVSSGAVIPPASSRVRGGSGKMVALELEDGTVYQGYSFGAE